MTQLRELTVFESLRGHPASLSHASYLFHVVEGAFEDVLNAVIIVVLGMPSRALAEDRAQRTLSDLLHSNSLAEQV